MVACFIFFACSTGALVRGEPIIGWEGCPDLRFVAGSEDVVEPLQQALEFWGLPGPAEGGIVVRVAPDEVSDEHYGETKIYRTWCEIVLEDASVKGLVAHEIGHALGYVDSEVPGVMHKNLYGATK